MHRFFYQSHTDLHLYLLDILTSSRSIHSILPLFHVNRHFRQLVTQRLVKPLSGVSGVTRDGQGRVKVAVGQGFIKLVQAEPIIMAGEQPPVLRTNDTRLLFRDEETARGWDEDAEANESVFVLKKYDPKTTICTFGSPPAHRTSLTFTVPVKPTGEVDFDCEHPSRAVWQIGSSMWFIKSTPQSIEEEGAKSYGGLELGLKQHRHAAREVAFVTKVSDKRCGVVSDSNFKLRNGWYGTVETKRLKRRNLKDECDQLHAAVQLDVKEIRVPLLLLYVGPTSLDDFKSLQYECEYYSVKSVEEFEEKFFDGADSWDY
ncbi:hypothetical protein JCM5350_005110 [Sporobolomyces pararoseus]